MVSTRSSIKDKKMVVSKETSDYFTKSVEPMVSKQRLEEMFGKFKEEILERFEEKFTAQNQRIVDLEKNIPLQEKKIEEGNEQYSRRFCIRMHALKYDKNEGQKDIVSKISECFSEIGLPYNEAETYRVHPIGKPYKNESLDFKSYRYRQDFCRN